MTSSGPPPGFALLSSSSDDIPEGFEELEPNDDHLFPGISKDQWNALPTKTRTRASIHAPDFLCNVCAKTKLGSPRRFCESCQDSIERLIAIYHEAVSLYPAVKSMKLPEFFERLWEREKARIKNGRP